MQILNVKHGGSIKRVWMSLNDHYKLRKPLVNAGHCWTLLDIAGHCWTKQEQTTISENGELFSGIQSWLAGKSPNFMAGWWYTY